MVDAIASLAQEEIGPTADRPWRVMFWGGMAPELGRDLWLTSAFEDLLADDTLDPAIREAILALQSQYNERLYSLREQAYRQGVRACAKYIGVVRYEPEQQAYRESLMAITELHSAYLNLVEGVLSEPSRMKFREARTSAPRGEMALGLPGLPVRDP